MLFTSPSPRRRLREMAAIDATERPRLIKLGNRVMNHVRKLRFCLTDPTACEQYSNGDDFMRWDMAPIIQGDAERLRALGRLLGLDGMTFINAAQEAEDLLYHAWCRQVFVKKIEVLVACYRQHRVSSAVTTFVCSDDDKYSYTFVVDLFQHLSVDPKQRCAFCNEAPAQDKALMTCGGCEIPLYCDRLCEKMDRKAHEPNCKEPSTASPEDTQPASEDNTAEVEVGSEDDEEDGGVSLWRTENGSNDTGSSHFSFTCSGSTHLTTLVKSDCLSPEHLVPFQPSLRHQTTSTNRQPPEPAIFMAIMTAAERARLLELGQFVLNRLEKDCAMLAKAAHPVQKEEGRIVIRLNFLSEDEKTAIHLMKYDAQRLQILGEILNEDGTIFTTEGNRTESWLLEKYNIGTKKTTNADQVEFWKLRQTMDEFLASTLDTTQHLLEKDGRLEGEMDWKLQDFFAWGDYLQRVPAAVGRQKCAFCGDQEADHRVLRACGSCKKTLYCDRTCQKMHWRKEHKAVCKKADKAEGTEDMKAEERQERKAKEGGAEAGKVLEKIKEMKIEDNETEEGKMADSKEGNQGLV
ncbi:unnamed protein product [Zymoseptoria tritici ST99CH_1E4]|uniref:MYND-type domain-containing protein n=1 Tax=Zymoseptoria tritici ST99CH_1E4 TaxID=1276532 RepID=A0A2H1GTC1_ZYMTR|nr:unnamed protein product [Zymoseptoria tritici ST99CH_1E4]